jgi:hypothetical protein
MSLLPWLRSILSRHHYPVASANDPRPTVVNLLRVLPRVWRQLARRRARRGLPGNGT